MPRTTSNCSVRIVLTDASLDPGTPISLATRSLELNAANNWTARVGRATSSGTGPDQAAHNACFRSRVVSREHAYITADPEDGTLNIEDAGSMHGTRLHGSRLDKGQLKALRQGDVVVFGASIERGAQTFSPIEVRILWTWNNNGPSSSSTKRPNSFEVPYSDDEEEYDHHKYDAVRESPKMTEEPRPYVVHSDLDDVISIESDEESLKDIDSPSSSPVASQEDVIPTKKSTSIQTAAAGEVSDKEGRQLQEAPFLSAQRPPRVQSKFSSIAELLEDQAERMSGSQHAPRSSSDIDPQDILGDEFGDDFALQEIDELDEVDDFGDEDPTLAETRSRLQAPPAALQRDPSPSDAAMVKPISDTLRAPPFGPVSLSAAAPGIVPEGSARRSHAWAGHNSGLYQQPLPMMSTPSYDFYDYSTSFAAGSVPIAGNYQQTNHVVEPYPSNQRKRKADRMDEDGESQILRLGTPSVASAPQDYDVASQLDDTGLPTITVTETTDTIKSPPPPAVVTGGTRKKQKTSKNDTGARSSKSSSFVKLAGATIAGVAVGTVGTILGLAALPADYFV